MRQSLKLHLTVSALVVAAVPVLAAPPAEKLAQEAEKALAKKKHGKAIAQAEAAAAAAPRDAGIRMVLGRVYLESGRFRSAAASFGDALALDPSRGTAALSLTLAKLALGDRDGARTVLATHGELISAGDRGLALALAGDIATAVPLLEAAVRDGGSDAKTRQNLAFAYALAGRWPEAKLMASYDLDAATLSQRIMGWAQLAREGQAQAQVAALLGVTPAEDAGQPVRLALQAPAAPVSAPVQLAAAAAAAMPPPPARMVEPAPAEPQPAIETPPVETPSASVPADEPAMPYIAPAPAPVRQPIAFPVPAPAQDSPAAAKPIAAVAPRLAPLPRPTGGRFAVQIGAFDSLGVAQASWDRSARRIGMLRDYVPSTATVVRAGAVFHRLSVSGFATRAEAVRVCETLRLRGGTCFVRNTAGDMPLQWVMRGGGTRMAAR